MTIDDVYVWALGERARGHGQTQFCYSHRQEIVGVTQIQMIPLTSEDRYTGVNADRAAAGTMDVAEAVA